jgi:hypothetical protein
MRSPVIGSTVGVFNGVTQLKTMKSMLYVNFAASIMALISATLMHWLLIK